MERGSLEKLKFDKRLRTRRGWVADQEIEDHLESLPDLSDKIAVESEESTEQFTEQSTQQQEAPAATPSEAMASGVGEPGVVPADEFGDRPVDPLSPPPFKEV